MDYEQKYKEALEKAKYWHKEGWGRGCQELVEDIFPELKESEDEKIRKAILELVRQSSEILDKQNQSNMIAWLEKQKEPELSEDLGEYVAELSKQFPEVSFAKLSRIAVRVKNWLEKQGGIESDPRYEYLEELLAADDIYQMSMNDEMVQEAKEKVVNALSGMCIGRLLGLEKQGKQKPSLHERYDKIKDSEWFKKTHEGMSISDDENVDGDMKETEHTIKPKFHEGDWITCEELNTALIVNIVDDKYEVEFVDGNKGFPHIDYIDRLFHLWTIKDAKDGDVLAVDSKPFIYNGSKNEVTVGAYCGFNSEHKFSFAYNYVINQNITPATKEQRKLLFQKMEEAGWEFDFENKELKKIEKNIDVNHEYFSELLKNDDSKDINYYAYQVAYCMSHDWIEETATWDDVERACKLGAEWNERHHNSSWSEEDEKFFKTALWHISYSISNGESTDIHCDTTEWFKSLKERYTWRPSDKQMHAFEQVYNWYNDNIAPSETLTSLYNDLKKLC